MNDDLLAEVQAAVTAAIASREPVRLRSVVNAVMVSHPHPKGPHAAWYWRAAYEQVRELAVRLLWPMATDSDVDPELLAQMADEHLAHAREFRRYAERKRCAS